jgi:hypothetical protein
MDRRGETEKRHLQEEREHRKTHRKNEADTIRKGEECS